MYGPTGSLMLDQSWFSIRMRTPVWMGQAPVQVPVPWSVVVVLVVLVRGRLVVVVLDVVVVGGSCVVVVGRCSWSRLRGGRTACSSSLSWGP